MGMAASLDSYIESALLGVHTSIPAEVVDYNAGSHTAKVKPGVAMLMSNGVKIELPELAEVPVVFPSAASFDLEFPLKRGDGVLLVFSESDISEWKAGKKGANAASPSRFSLDGAVAIPGLAPSPSKGRARLVVDSNGVVTFTAKKIVFDGQVVAKKAILARDDVYVGPEPTGPGVSLKNHIHPTPAGPSSPATPSPLPPEEM